MAGRGSQTFKKRQKEQQRLEKRQEKFAKRLQRKLQPKDAEGSDTERNAGTEENETGEPQIQPQPQSQDVG